MDKFKTHLRASLAAATLLLTWSAVPAEPATLTFTLLPGSAIDTAAGSTAGWGYKLTNITSDWVETLNLTADVFTNGTATSLFDFPVIAPGATVSVPFSSVASGTCPAPDCGLFEFTWDSGAAFGSLNSGTFTITSELFGTNPITDPNAVDLGTGTDATTAYSITVSGVPEPATQLLLLVGSGLLLVSRFTRRKNRR